MLEIKSETTEFNGPSVSKVTTKNSYKWDKSKYLDSFLEAAPSAAEPALMEVEPTYDMARVSHTGTSQMADLPDFHGISVRPSGCLPSDLESHLVPWKPEYVPW